MAASQFEVFSKAVHAKFVEMSKRELFIINVEDLFQKYLDSYPEGTNPIFRERGTYDCQCCKSFVRRLGSLVNIVEGKLISVWDLKKLPEPYQTVADKMSSLVKAGNVNTVFRTKEKKFSVDHNYDGKTNERYDHFYATISDKHHSKEAETKRGEQETIRQVMKRGLEEIKLSHIDDVLDLIQQNGLYRGEEHKPAILGFKELLKQYEASKNKDLFVWENLANRNSRFRNTVIGTLFTDLAEGKDFDYAVKGFETKVAPANYKRPTTVITQKMVEAAVQTLTDLGLGGAIYRRFAKISDVSVNDVLFVDNEVASKMKDGGIAELLGSSIKKTTPNLDNAIPITSDEFVKTILPTTKSLEVFVENRHMSNFVSLTGSDGPERIFKWNNNFAWAYDGDMADSDLRKRVQALGGRVDGVLRFSHQWNYDKRNASLMDLHVFMPGSSKHEDGCHDKYPTGQRVGWNRRNDPTSGGVQDVDYTNAAPEGYVPVENITFPTMDRLKQGEYTFKIHNWTLRQPTQGGFRAEIECGGQVFQYEMVKPLKQKEWVTVATATLKNGVFTVNHVLSSSKTSQEKWGVSTESLVPVTTVMNSPNHWGDQSVGAKHLIFALKGCKNPDSVRGIFNEYLRPELEKDRKVFEVLGSKSKAKPTDDQISGVGFTKARGDSVTVVVNGRRSYVVSF